MVLSLPSRANIVGSLLLIRTQCYLRLPITPGHCYSSTRNVTVGSPLALGTVTHSHRPTLLGNHTAILSVTHFPIEGSCLSYIPTYRAVCLPCFCFELHDNICIACLYYIGKMSFYVKCYLSSTNVF